MSDRARAALGAIVQDESRALPYALCYPCEVIKDWGNMTLDLMPEDTELLPPLERIPLRVGVPGLTIRLKVGARVWLAFDNAEADRPLAYLFESGQVERWQLKTGLGQEVTVDDWRGMTTDDADYSKPGVTVKDAAGQTVFMDATPTAPKVLVTDAAGQTVLMNAKPGAARVKVTAASGATLDMTPGGNIDVTTPALFTYNGREVACIGDRTQGADPQGGVQVTTIVKP